MPTSELQPSPFLPSRPVPSVTEVDRIASLSQPVLRNLLITQCYCELSSAFAERMGKGANWCTFALWASKQAGQTIRKEDLVRSLEASLKKEPEIGDALGLIATLAKQMGARQTMDQIRQTALGVLVTAAVDRSSEAVSRGNKKVFEEIAREFARFMATCYTDAIYSVASIESFCRSLRPGMPPNGQEYLQRAFSRYYESIFEEDPRKKTELRFLANLEIGFHEQTRLQPEIAESLNAAKIDPQEVKNRLLDILFPGAAHRGNLKGFFQSFIQKTSLLDKAVELLVQRAQLHLRIALTAHMMTLALSKDKILRLGSDLDATYPATLLEILNKDLLLMLSQVDPTPNSLRLSGATDWANLQERLHYIADLFRCYHEAGELFDPPFSVDQVMALKAGRLPTGRL